MIEVRNLVKRYGDYPALDDVSFTLEDGKIYGFLGPNGAGKTTTMNIMTGYLTPTEGEVVINGHSIAKEPEKAKRSIGYLPEIPPLYTDMTVTEYLRFAAELKKIPAKDRADAVNEVITLSKLEDVTDRLIANLSKGYKQRVGLAQAVLGMPEIVILDEPTAGLDPKQIIEIRNLIRSLGKDHTVILSSHILSEIQELCDSIIIIHHGRIIADGTPQELEEKLGNSSMELTVKTDDTAAAVELFGAIPGVESVTVSDRSADTETSLDLKLTRGADVREDIFNTCVEKGLPLLMMKASQFSLEQVFLELTRERRLVRRRIRKSTESDQVPEPIDDETQELSYGEAPGSSDDPGSDGMEKEDA
ncbi:MAG: ABC transporter ATP-binding protein [Oscillospiraceae bacterium]|nr:ABC transporter ATP-binding protein [Oscillospiraceae bacterium]